MREVLAGFDAIPEDDNRETGDRSVRFRKEFEVDSSLRDRPWVLRVQANEEASVFLNGSEIGRIAGGRALGKTQPFLWANGSDTMQFVIAGANLREGENVISVEVKSASEPPLFVVEFQSAPDPDFSKQLSRLLKDFDPGSCMAGLQQETGLRDLKLSAGWRQFCLAQLAALGGGLDGGPGFNGPGLR